MNLERIKKISNPYYPIEPQKSKNDFVGREYYIETLRKELDNYERTSKLKNVIISGEKSIGKTSLLKRYQDVLEDYGFVVYEVELFRNTDFPIDEFEFFKEFLNDLFKKYSPSEG